MKLGPGNNHAPLTIDFSEYLDGLYRYAVVLWRNRTEAEDLVEETCLRALRAMQELRPDSNIKSWLFTIWRNIWLNQLRQSRTTLEMSRSVRRRDASRAKLVVYQKRKYGRNGLRH